MDGPVSQDQNNGVVQGIQGLHLPTILHSLFEQVTKESGPTEIQPRETVGIEVHNALKAHDGFYIWVERKIETVSYCPSVVVFQNCPEAVGCYHAVSTVVQQNLADSLQGGLVSVWIMRVNEVQRGGFGGYLVRAREVDCDLQVDFESSSEVHDKSVFFLNFKEIAQERAGSPFLRVLERQFGFGLGCIFQHLYVKAKLAYVLMCFLLLFIPALNVKLLVRVSASQQLQIHLNGLPDRVQVVWDDLCQVHCHPRVISADLHELEIGVAFIPEVEPGVSVHQLYASPAHANNMRALFDCLAPGYQFARLAGSLIPYLEDEGLLIGTHHLGHVSDAKAYIGGLVWTVLVVYVEPNQLTFFKMVRHSDGFVEVRIEVIVLDLGRAYYSELAQLVGHGHHHIGVGLVQQEIHVLQTSAAYRHLNLSSRLHYLKCKQQAYYQFQMQYQSFIFHPRSRPDLGQAPLNLVVFGEFDPVDFRREMLDLLPDQLAVVYLFDNPHSLNLDIQQYFYQFNKVLGQGITRLVYLTRGPLDLWHFRNLEMHLAGRHIPVLWLVWELLLQLRDTKGASISEKQYFRKSLSNYKEKYAGNLQSGLIQFRVRKGQSERSGVMECDYSVLLRQLQTTRAEAPKLKLQLNQQELGSAQQPKTTKFKGKIKFDKSQSERITHSAVQTHVLSLLSSSVQTPSPRSGEAGSQTQVQRRSWCGQTERAGEQEQLGKLKEEQKQKEKVSMSRDLLLRQTQQQLDRLRKSYGAEFQKAQQIIHSLQLALRTQDLEAERRSTLLLKQNSCLKHTIQQTHLQHQRALLRVAQPQQKSQQTSKERRKFKDLKDLELKHKQLNELFRLKEQELKRIQNQFQMSEQAKEQLQIAIQKYKQQIFSLKLSQQRSLILSQRSRGISQRQNRPRPAELLEAKEQTARLKGVILELERERQEQGFRHKLKLTQLDTELALSREQVVFLRSKLQQKIE